MSPLITAALMLLALALSAIFSGSETGLYSLSRPRLDLEAGRGSRGARLLRGFADRRAALLITILIGNNLAIESMTLLAEHWFGEQGVGHLERELLLTLVLTPVIFFFAELLPKDLYRRRPHVLMRLSAPVLVVFRILFYPLERVLRGVSRALEMGLRLAPAELAAPPGRLQVLGVLAEGREAGVLESHAEELALNALKLRTLPVTRAMIPWKEVTTIDVEASEEDRRKVLEGSVYTRLPVCGAEGVVGYVHQLTVLGAGPGAGVLDQVRPQLFFAPDLSVERALARLRMAGRRGAVVGSAQEPLGLVTLKDLLEEISGDLGGW